MIVYNSIGYKNDPKKSNKKNTELDYTKLICFGNTSYREYKIKIVLFNKLNSKT